MTRRLIPILAAAMILAPLPTPVFAEEAPAKAATEAKKSLLPDKADDAWADVK